MSKKSINLKYKSKKRDKNKNKIIIEEKTEFKSVIKTILFVLGFIGIIYLAGFALEKMGVFEEGYTKPSATTEISYDNILIGEVFNRNEKEYLVVFDTFGDDTNDVYVEYLIGIYKKLNIYKVDMSSEASKKYLSDKSNKNAKKVSDLKINGITLIRIKNGKIIKYITGNDNISEYIN